MRHDKILATENNFFASGDANGRRFHLGEIGITNAKTGETFKVTKINAISGDQSFYSEDSKKEDKKRVMLHFTMGWLKGDLNRLTTPGDHVSVPFVISRSGKIVQLFGSVHWSYHLGKRAIGGNKTMSKSSIGIEISNIGPLVLVGDKLMTTYKTNGKFSDEYCRLGERDAYIKLEKKYRGYEYYASFTKEQIEITAKLVKFLAQKYDIPLNFIATPNRYETLKTGAEATGYRGILSHVNVRTDKADIGPAFPWDKFIQLVKS